VRFQFLEILVRLAYDKYVRTSLCSSVYEAISEIYENSGIMNKIISVEES